MVVTEEELQRGADTFRRNNGLTSAKATEEWMSRYGITPEFFQEFLECAILFSTYKDRQDSAHLPYPLEREPGSGEGP
jgi:hypothetical protein